MHLPTLLFALLLVGCTGSKGDDDSATTLDRSTGTGTGATTGTGGPGSATGAGTGVASGATGTGTGAVTGSGTGAVTGTGTGVPTDTSVATGTGATSTGTSTGSGTGSTSDTAVLPTPIQDASCAPTSNPLRFVCSVTVDPPQPVQVRFARRDGRGQVRTHGSAGVASSHEVDLYFMAPEQVYDVVAMSEQAGDPGLALSLTTGVVPPAIHAWLEVTGTARTPMVGGQKPCDSKAVAVVFDTSTGDMLWYKNLDPSGNLSTGRMVRFSDDHTVMGETGNTITEVSLDGEVRYSLQRYIDYDDFFHHDVMRVDDRVYALNEYDDGGLRVHEVVVMRTDGTLLGRWDPREHLDIPPDATGDFFHSNTIFVDGNDDMVISFWSQDTVIKAVGDPSAPDFGRVLWRLGNRRAGVGNDFTFDWSGIAAGPEFGHQHNVRLVAPGRLSMLDNLRGRALFFELNEATFTARAVETYQSIEDRCSAQGTAVETALGTVLVGCNLSALREYDVGASVHRWEATPVCELDAERIEVARFYPLVGW